VASIYQSIEILSKEKGIDPQIVLDAVKDAMLVAARKQFRTAEELTADFDPQTGAIVIYAVKTVADPVTDPTLEISLAEALRYEPAAQVGMQIRIPRPTEALGRISAQTAKQVILQKVREAERDNIFAEYSHRVGELVNCTVKRIEGMDLIVDLGKTEARLPKKEQSRLENFSVGDRIRCVIKSVEKTGKNAGVIVSRASGDLVMRLFEQEVPEIYDGTVVIRGCAREAGERTKIAVLSRDRDVDCVGACVGMKGMRVQSIIRELRGEKIDIIEYSDDAAKFVEKALSPAKITRVSILDSNEKHMEVIVEDSQLSLAIGKKGQNVRLAAKLLGWRIDIKTEEEKRQEVEAAMASMRAGTPIDELAVYGLSAALLETLHSVGINTVERAGGMTPEELEQNAGLDHEAIVALSSAINSYYAHLDAALHAQTAAGEPEASAVRSTEGEAAAGEPETEAGAQPEQAPPDEPLQKESDTMEAAGLPLESEPGL
jgi:N utilization substance protein A